MSPRIRASAGRQGSPWTLPLVLQAIALPAAAFQTLAPALQEGAGEGAPPRRPQGRARGYDSNSHQQDDAQREPPGKAEVDLKLEWVRPPIWQGLEKFATSLGQDLDPKLAKANGVGLRSTAINAEGFADSEGAMPRKANLGAVMQGAGRGRLMQAIAPDAPWLPASTEEEEGSQAVATLLVQTDLDLEARRDNFSALEPGPAGWDWYNTEPLLGLCNSRVRTLTTHVQLETLRALGAFPEKLDCRDDPDEAAVEKTRPPQVNFEEELFSQVTSMSSTNRNIERFIIVGYVVFYIICVSYMWYSMVHPSKLGERAVQYHMGRKVVTEIDVEEETWQHGALGWLGCSWASSWVARWGHSLDAALTKIKADQLPQLGNRDHQCIQCAGLFKKLWKEQIDVAGKQKASITKVIVDIWTRRLMFTMCVLAAFQQTIAQMYGIFLIEKGLRYFYWLQTEQARQPEKHIPMGVPLLLAIAMFSAMPLVNCILHSLSGNISRRMDQKLCGALSVAVFEKAQRLPSNYLHPTLRKNEVTGATEETPPLVDMMQLIGYDINGNIGGAYGSLCILLNSFVACIVFTNMLWARLRLATLIAFGVSIPIIGSICFISSRMAWHGYRLQMVGDQRIRTLRELLWGIRIVKAYAWEDAVEARITTYREKELSILETYWYYIGLTMGIGQMFPRILIIGALWGYVVMYGTHDVANIFVCVQLLGCLKGSCEGLAGTMSRAITIQPSLQRLDTFMKMAEAPVLLPDLKPDWVDQWPKRSEEEQSGNVDKGTKLTVQGTFAWSEDGTPVLHDIDLSVNKGEMLAIVGRVGSGKSTLLQAILGELYPDLEKQALLSRPEVIAYCSQVPHIGEGTLRENVLFGQAYDASRYAEAIAGASLEPDLTVLPGGDGVCIGSRGITLSGGQKARVALARAAYHKGSDVLLVDDPFGAVDAPTAMILLDRLLLGPLMEGRTRVVILQPDAERLQKFDRVAVMENGRILEQGPPEEVMQTEAYANILSSTSRDFANTVNNVDENDSRLTAVGKAKEDNRAMRVKLREEDFEGRPTIAMVKQYCRIGRWRNIFNTSMLFCVQVFFWLLADLVLANWTNEIAKRNQVNDRYYIYSYLFWFVFGCFLWAAVWKFGMWFTLRISGKIVGMMLSSLLRGPIDKFFDKQPVGRIMNRMVGDVATVDFSLFLRSTGTLAIVYQTMIPLAYVHFVLPWFVTLLAVPVYLMMWQLCKRYWNTTVPLRYCAVNSRSDVNSLIADVSNNNTVIRAYRDQDRITQDMCDAMDNQLKADLYGGWILRRWLMNRVLFLWSFYITTTYMVGMMNTKWMGTGTLGLCLGNLMLIQYLLEPNLDHATGAQLEFIALARIHEYMNIPQEKPNVLEGDYMYQSFAVKFDRAWLGNLKSIGQGNTLEVLRGDRTLLRTAKNGNSLVMAAEGCTLQDLCPKCEKLKDATASHHIVCINQANRDVDLMADQLCRADTDQVLIEIQSDWLVNGARVVIENLKAGYADIPRDVLKGINVTFEPMAKVGIVGTTGCGKSSLLLVMLRLLEPRAGRVLLNGVDTRNVGLSTLRRVLGLVPQDPVLFTGSLRFNLDPFGEYPESRLWRALELAHLTKLVKSWDDKLDQQIVEEGANLSYGQRQLTCLARMVLRQPALLLLDEATSAIDPRTQEEVQNTIVTAFPHSTLIAIAHRLETIFDFDFVCVMERGEIVERGPVKEVSQHKGGYLRKMLEAKRSW